MAVRSGSFCEDSILLEELAVLQAIYIDELVVEEDDNHHPSTVILELHPATGNDLTKRFVCMTLVLKPPLAYPEELPEIRIKNPRGVGDEELQSLQEAMNQLAEMKRGGPMLYQLIEMAKETLTEGNIPRCPCVICQEHFDEGDEFIRTECYHYFHKTCFGRYIMHAVAESEVAQQDDQIVCPVCREILSFDAEDMLEDSIVLEADNFTFVPSQEMRDLQKQMAELWTKQKSKGGIINLQEEKDKFLVNADSVISLPSDEKTASKEKGQTEDKQSERRHRDDLLRGGQNTSRTYTQAKHISDRRIRDQYSHRDWKGWQRRNESGRDRKFENGRNNPEKRFYRNGKKQQNCDYHERKGNQQSNRNIEEHQLTESVKENRDGSTPFDECSEHQDTSTNDKGLVQKGAARSKVSRPDCDQSQSQEFDQNGLLKSENDPKSKRNELENSPGRFTSEQGKDIRYGTVNQSQEKEKSDIMHGRRGLIVERQDSRLNTPHAKADRQKFKSDKHTRYAENKSKYDRYDRHYSQHDIQGLKSKERGSKYDNQIDRPVDRRQDSRYDRQEHKRFIDSNNKYISQNSRSDEHRSEDGRQRFDEEKTRNNSSRDTARRRQQKFRHTDGFYEDYDKSTRYYEDKCYRHGDGCRNDVCRKYKANGKMNENSKDIQASKLDTAPSEENYHEQNGETSSGEKSPTKKDEKSELDADILQTEKPAQNDLYTDSEFNIQSGKGCGRGIQRDQFERAGKVDPQLEKGLKDCSKILKEEESFESIRQKDINKNTFGKRKENVTFRQQHLEHQSHQHEENEINSERGAKENTNIESSRKGNIGDNNVGYRSGRGPRNTGGRTKQIYSERDRGYNEQRGYYMKDSDFDRQHNRDRGFEREKRYDRNRRQDRVHGRGGTCDRRYNKYGRSRESTDLNPDSNRSSKLDSDEASSTKCCTKLNAESLREGEVQVNQDKSVLNTCEKQKVTSNGHSCNRSVPCNKEIREKNVAGASGSICTSTSGGCGMSTTGGEGRLDCSLTLPPGFHLTGPPPGFKSKERSTSSLQDHIAPKDSLPFVSPPPGFNV